MSQRQVQPAGTTPAAHFQRRACTPTVARRIDAVTERAMRARTTQQRQQREVAMRHVLNRMRHGALRRGWRGWVVAVYEMQREEMVRCVPDNCYFFKKRPPLTLDMPGGGIECGPCAKHAVKFADFD